VQRHNGNSSQTGVQSRRGTSVGRTRLPSRDLDEKETEHFL